ncbi:MAG: DUF4435 domain-containing protein [Tannerella sp.]|jgi:hypothetical protein|nr:DUF4435 domain-containing protein [Tannerella sp.]
MLRKHDIDQFYRQQALYFKNRARMKRCAAAVHLESDADMVFWAKLFRHYLPQVKFDYVFYSRTPEGYSATGCTACLRYLKLGCLSREFFVCIDSDYRYLSEEADIDAAHGVFQTYTYSWENHYCIPRNLEGVLRKLDLPAQRFPFGAFLERYSRTLYELFLYHLVSELRDDGYFIQEAFRPYLNLPTPLPEIKELTDAIGKRAESRLRRLRRYYRDVDREALAGRFAALGLKPENAYLYFRGHNIFDHLAMPLLQKLTGLKGRDLRRLLTEDLYFDAYPEIRKIQEDIQMFFRKN